MTDTQDRVQVSRSQLVAQLRRLGVRDGGILVVHTSFRAVRPVEGGPLGLINALREAIGPDGTLVMPAWSGDDSVRFDPSTSAVATDLGIVADFFRQQPGVVRSGHPNAFAAAGPRALEINRDVLPLPPHVPESPIGRVYDLDGELLLLGVGHAANTTLHLAELIAGVPYRIQRAVTVFEYGQPRRIEYGENDHCCELFSLADEWLRERGLQAEGLVGHAQARLMRSRDLVEVAREHLSRDRVAFLHPPSVACEECDAARESVTSSKALL
jgi:aminoglycoside 3-N-acetyltransferase IV